MAKTTKGITQGLFFGGTEFHDLSVADDTQINEVEGSGYVQDEFDDSEEEAEYQNPQTGERSEKRQRSPNDSDGPPEKFMRPHGGRAATTKPVSADYDSDDGRIIELKQQGYSDGAVSQKLLQENRVRYLPKTVASRYLRLRKVLEEAEDNRLDDELSDWHVGEDDELQESINAIDEKLAREIQRLRDKKWKEVSINLAGRLDKKKYTGKACKERVEALQDGTALEPIELDPDQEGRRAMREARIVEARHRRAEAAEEAKRAEYAKQERTERKKREKQEKYEQQLRQKEDARAQQAEEKRIREERAEDSKRLREAKAANLAAMQDEAKEKKRVKGLEDLLLSRWGALPKRRRGGGLRKKDDFIDDTSDENGGGIDLSDEEEAQETDDETGSKPSGSKARTTPSRSKKAISAPTSAKVTKETLLNPRSIMTDEEIEVLLFQRGLPRRGDDESHPHVVARLAAHDAELSSATLSELLGKYFDKTKGRKELKIQRLQQYEAMASAAGLAGIKATDPEFKEGYVGYKE